MMKNKLLQITIVLILPLLLAFTWAPPALAQGPDGDQVVFGDNLVLDKEEEISGDVVVFGGNVTMPASSEIDGDLVVFGGNAEINGTVTGDIGMIGGNIVLGKTAVVEGDIGLLGGNAEVAEGAVVEGDVQSLNRFGFGDKFSIPPIPSVIPVPPVAPVPPVPPVEPDAPRPPVQPTPPAPPLPRDHVGSSFSEWTDGVFDFFREVVEVMAVLLSLAVVSWLVAAFMPEQMRVVGDTFTRSAPLSFVVGLLTPVVLVIVGGVLAITICLAFVPVLGFILLGIATLFGWIVAGQIIGERLLVASGRSYPNPIGATVLGVMVLTIVTAMPIVEHIPCIGWVFGLVGGLLGLIIAMTGLGAVILTRFGTQPYPPQEFAFAGGPSVAPQPAPTGGSSQLPSNPLSSLEQREAELRAKIDAALAEADAAAPVEVEPVEETPESSDENGAEGEEKPKPKSRRRRKSDEEPEQNPA